MLTIWKFLKAPVIKFSKEYSFHKTHCSSDDKMGKKFQLVDINCHAAAKRRISLPRQ